MRGNPGGLSPLSRKFGIRALKPVVPKDIRNCARDMFLVGLEVDEVAVHIEKRYKAGEWNEDIAAGGFGHIAKFKSVDWRTLCKGVRASIRKSEIQIAMGEEPNIRGRKSALVIEAHAKAIVDARNEAAEAEADEIGDDAKKRLDRLRRALMARLTIAEQADLLVAQARSDHGATSRSATAHIIEILGMKAANVADAPGSAPIFALPEGVGPSIR